MSGYEAIAEDLAQTPKRWLVTGVAGFIGSNILERLLHLGQQVVGLDNFATGKRENIEHVRRSVGDKRWERFRIIEGDIRNAKACAEACSGVDFVLHQAALGSVPASLANPLGSNENNVSGFINILLGARDAKVRRVVYASSSAVYGDDPGMPKKEEAIGAPLSPYAATKLMDEIYAGVFSRCYGVESVGLRYFNVFGPRQDPAGAYAAVIPLWLSSMLKREAVHINGDGQTSRDFCYIADVVQANILAAVASGEGVANQVYNIGLGERTTLNELFRLLGEVLRQSDPSIPEQKPHYRAFREGDVRHSLADITKARRLLGYAPQYRIGEGLKLAMEWYRQVVR